MIEVTLAGFYSSVQDLGRLGYRHLGVGMSGAMDTLALSVANVLVGNPAGAAALEITMGLAAFTFHADTEIALGGASAHATLDGRSLPNWWAVSVKAGQVLRFGALEAGVRSYVAVRGGLDVQPVLGSASTDLKGGFGGLGGRPLKNGDRLSAKAAAPSGRPNRGFGLSPWRPDPYQESRPGGSCRDRRGALCGGRHAGHSYIARCAMGRSNLAGAGTADIGGLGNRSGEQSRGMPPGWSGIADEGTP